MATALGYFVTRRKSSGSKDNPIPSIMIAKATGERTVVKKLACIINFVEITTKHHIRLFIQTLIFSWFV